MAAVFIFTYSSERGNLALCQHFSENLTQHCCDSYKNTSAQRINSGFDSVLSSIKFEPYYADRKIWYKINTCKHIALLKCQTQDWVKIIYRSFHRERERVQPLLLHILMRGLYVESTYMYCSCYLRQPQGGPKSVQTLIFVRRSLLEIWGWNSTIIMRKQLRIQIKHGVIKVVYRVVFPSLFGLWSLNSQPLNDLYLEYAAASKRIFTLLGPLFVRSQSDDFSAVAGALVADITTCGIKNTFGKKTRFMSNVSLLKK